MERTDDDLLVAFIEKTRASGISDATTVEILKQRGWSERRIYRAFSTAVERTLGFDIPVRGSAQEYARDAYLYLVSFITLALWSYSLGNIFYVMIDYWIPDRANGWTIPTHELPQYLSWPIAMLVVAFPIFMFVNAALQRDLSQRPEGFSTGVRKWLTYIALVGTVATLVFDAVSFLQAFLLGNLTAHFILDSLVLLLVAGGNIFLLPHSRSEHCGCATTRTPVRSCSNDCRDCNPCNWVYSDWLAWKQARTLRRYAATNQSP